MRADKLPVDDLDFTNEANRKKIGLIIMRLFDHWSLTTEEQLSLLGLSSKSRALLTKYRKGQAAINPGRDTLDRVGWLLATHKALRLLYPENENIRYSWIKRRNKVFNNLTPLQVMITEGMIGVAKVSRYLDFQRGM